MLIFVINLFYYKNNTYLYLLDCNLEFISKRIISKLLENGIIININVKMRNKFYNDNVRTMINPFLKIKCAK